MSPELETLDQLLDGDLSLAIIRSLYPDDDRFHQGITGLLLAGEVSLLSGDQEVIPAKNWPRLLQTTELSRLKLRITEQGVRKMK